MSEQEHLTVVITDIHYQDIPIGPVNCVVGGVPHLATVDHVTDFVTEPMRQFVVTIQGLYKDPDTELVTPDLFASVTLVCDMREIVQGTYTTKLKSGIGQYFTDLARDLPESKRTKMHLRAMLAIKLSKTSTLLNMQLRQLDLPDC